MTFFKLYMDFSQMHFSSKTQYEKRSLCTRLLSEWGNASADSVTAKIILQQLHKQDEQRSANAYNKDRKDLMTMWAHGFKFLGFENKPTLGISKFPHERGLSVCLRYQRK